MKSVDEQFNQAMQDGKFDNLPGKGKPLKLDDNPHSDPEWRVAHHMLQSGGFTLPWIESRQEIEQHLENARRDLQGAWERLQRKNHTNHLASNRQAEWQQALDRFQTEVKVINQRIFTYNLETPSDQFQRLPVKFDREVEKITRGPGG